MKFSVIVKPNSSRSEILGYDKDKNEYSVALKSAPIEGKANSELEKLMSKHLGKKVSVKIGKTSKKKILEAVD